MPHSSCQRGGAGLREKEARLLDGMCTVQCVFSICCVFGIDVCVAGEQGPCYSELCISISPDMKSGRNEYEDNYP